MNNKYLLTLFLGIILVGCSQSQIEISQNIPSEPTSIVVPSNAQDGHIRIKFDNNLSDEKIIEITSSSFGYNFVRSFPTAGKFEKRHREYGLHLWYEVFFDENIALTKAASELKDELEGVAEIEFVTPIKIQASSPFNDPRFAEHWHYYNDGSGSGTVAGSDINLLKAWEICRGSKDVIVAICDGGITYNHEDLAANMWVNEAELNGLPYVDDDGNGYEDDIYGYNFTVHDGQNAYGTITFDEHGTHVAGTVAAVNNNGIGVNGIAGGDSAEGNGVRLMSVQTTDEKFGAYVGQAIVYAADNGAVVMNCSWSMPESQSVREAIDYFNANAGIDENGNQVGAMAGGLCVFAAGNEATDESFPAMEKNAFAVASIGADMEMAYYTNYGTWVDITAPGGDAKKGYQILSTLIDGYGHFQGTSMAAPHVTGVAALVVSKYGKKGFTRDNLISILKNTANKELFRYNPGYETRLGAGLVDAAAALSIDEVPASAIKVFRGEAVSNIINLSWEKPAGSEAKIYSYTIYYSKKDLSTLDRDNLDKDVLKVVVPSDCTNFSISNLDFNTKYYFRIDSQNVICAYSELSNQISLTTEGNNPPVIEAVSPTDISITHCGVGAIRFKISDPDGHDLSYKVVSESSLPGLKTKREGEYVTIFIDALQFKDNTKYTAEFTVSDSYSSASCPFTFFVEPNHVPAVIAQFEDKVFNKTGEKLEIDLTKFFNDADGENLSFDVKISTTSIIAKCELNNDILYVTSNAYGYTDVQLTATDARGASVEAEFRVLVRDGSYPVDLYPNPVERFLNLRTETQSSVKLNIVNRSGAKVIKESEFTTGPFAPQTIDLDGLPTGKYYVTVTINGKSETYPIVKK